MTHLAWHGYRYFPYERDLARREVMAVLGRDRVEFSDQGARLDAPPDAEAAARLTYFAEFDAGSGATPTLQARLEQAARSGRTRQATRYSAHGLHEYKGRFNPQVARAVLNIFGAGPGSRILDPFCGSGTTLVECAHLGATGVGTDLNPLAVYLANAKLGSLSTPVDLLRSSLRRLSARLGRLRAGRPARDASPRGVYLRSWFSDEHLAWIEATRREIEEGCEVGREVFLALASDLLRDYSDQEPQDLRIRRRTSPLPETGFREAFLASCERFLDRLEAAQLVLGVLPLGDGGAFRADVRRMEGVGLGGAFDAALTSPPYATALPYIDTQRLSLVWLSLCPPEEVKPLEAALVGSREMARRERQEAEAAMRSNAAGLPDEQAEFCLGLAEAVGEGDGFRRQAVPVLIHRYFVGMRDAFVSVAARMRPGGPFALVVGHNHTVLSGVRRDIDTPCHLAALAAHAGWAVEEMIPLQTYQRYGMHAANAVGAETLLVLRRAVYSTPASSGP